MFERDDFSDPLGNIFNLPEVHVGDNCAPQFPIYPDPWGLPKTQGRNVFLQSPNLTLCDPMDCSTPGLPVPHHLLKFAQVHVHCITDAIQTGIEDRDFDLLENSDFTIPKSWHGRGAVAVSSRV